MKKLKKLACVLVALTCAITGSGLMTGCKKPVPNTAETLEVFAVKAGYGVAWMEAALDAFAEQDWVKEKYPNLIIPAVGTTTIASTAPDRITAGPKANTADLIYVTQTGADRYNVPYKDGYYLENLGEVYGGAIYNSDGSFEAVKDASGNVIPGAYYDGVNYTLQDKMYGALVEDYKVEMVNGKDKGTEQFYAMPAVNGWMGIIVNLDYLAVYAPEWASVDNLPKTTSELLQMCADIKNKEIGTKDTTNNPNANVGVPIVGCLSTNYWSSQFPVWWAQYEGLDGYPGQPGGYNEYMTIGMTIDGADEPSNEGWLQAGRLESLRVMDSLISRGSGNNHSRTYDGRFVEMQKLFLTGQGAMMYNGDWLENETATAGTWSDDNNVLMQQPVISAIVDKCSDGAFTCRYANTDIKNAASGKYNLDDNDAFDYGDLVDPVKAAKADEQLAFVITCIDAGKDFATTKAEYEAAFAADGVELLQADYQHIYNARYLAMRVEGQTWYVPSYANGKEVAKDFLRFLATDEGIAVSMANMRSMTPYKYTAQANDAVQKVIAGDANGHASTMLASRIAIQEKAVQLPVYESYRCNYLAGLRPLIPMSSIESRIMGQSAADRFNPWQIFNNEWVYIGTNFSSIVKRAAYGS